MELEQIGQELRNSMPQLVIVGCVVLGIVLISEGINYAQNQSLAKALGKIESAAVAAGAPLRYRLMPLIAKGSRRPLKPFITKMEYILM